MPAKNEFFRLLLCLSVPSCSSWATCCGGKSWHIETRTVSLDDVSSLEATQVGASDGNNL